MWTTIGLAVAAIIAFTLYMVLINIPSLRTYILFNRLEGLKGYPIIGSSMLLLSLEPEDIFPVIRKFSKIHKRFIAVWVAGVPECLLRQPEDLQVLMSSTTNIQKGLEYEMLKSWLCQGLLTSTGDKWHARRKLLTPAFHFKVLEDSLTAINKNSKVLLHKLISTNGETIDIENYLSLCALDIICEASMGINLDSQKNQGKEYVNSIKQFSETVILRILKVWMYKDFIFFLLSNGKRFRKLITLLQDFTKKVISEKKSKFSIDEINEKREFNTVYKKKRRMALLDCLLEFEYQNPGTLSDEDIREEVDTFMFEGHDTTTAAMMYSLFNIGHHPEIEERLYLEQMEVMGESDRPVTLDDLSKMTYLEMVIKETLRLYPSVPYISRYLTEDLVLKDNIVIPRGAMAVIIPWLTHRLEEYYPDPEKFDPERFSEEQIQNRHSFAYIPFSAGPRNCIGQKFAMFELKTVLSNIIRHLRVKTLTRIEDLKLVPFLILRPKSPIMCQFIPRKGRLDRIHVE